VYFKLTDMIKYLQIPSLTAALSHREANPDDNALWVGDTKQEASLFICFTQLCRQP